MDDEKLFPQKLLPEKVVPREHLSESMVHHDLTWQESCYQHDDDDSSTQHTCSIAGAAVYNLITPIV